MPLKKQSASSPLPDIDRCDCKTWPKRPFPVKPGEKQSVQVVIRRSVLNAIHAHGLSRTDVEVCGVLVGGVYQDERGPFIFIEGMIRGEYAENHMAQVTFTTKTWDHVHKQLDQHYPDKQILGWYHTHPGFGIFLSAMDMFIHENFFNSPEQLALVYDPLSQEQGLFVWQQGKAVTRSMVIVEDTPASQGEVKQKTRVRMRAAGGPETPGVEKQIKRLEGSLNLNTLLVALVAASILLYYWLLSRQLADMQAHIAEMQMHMQTQLTKLQKAVHARRIFSDFPPAPMGGSTRPQQSQQHPSHRPQNTSPTKPQSTPKNPSQRKHGKSTSQHPPKNRKDNSAPTNPQEHVPNARQLLESTQK